MEYPIRKENSQNETRIVIVSNMPDVVKKLEGELEQMGYKISIDTDPGARTSSLVNDAILRVSSADAEAFQAAPARGSLRGDYKEIIGESQQIFKVLQQIENLAATPLRVLIYGKTGTGKEMVARALHKNSGRPGKIVSVNCASIPENLLESELFGHEKGAFTSADARRIGRFERADKGTLFLDEIGEMPLAMQPKLLRAIEEGEIERVGGEKPIPVDVRIVAATNRDLVEAIKDKTFREDLYYRLDTASIVLPTLAERQEDIEALVGHFLEKHRLSRDSEIPQIALGTLVLLKNYPWPGNIRELENVVQSTFYSVKEGILLSKHLPEAIRMYQKRPVSISGEISTSEDEQKVSVSLGTTLEVMEETFILDTLAWLDGNRTKTAEMLRIGIRTLQRRLKKYDV